MVEGWIKEEKGELGVEGKEQDVDGWIKEEKGEGKEQGENCGIPSFWRRKCFPSPRLLSSTI